MANETVTIRAGDGHALGATHTTPAGEPRGAVVIASATGVPRRYYEPFCAFLAERGFATLRFDYRGIGDSRPDAGLRGFEARMHEWGERDLEAALLWLETRHPATPGFLVGHSAGGQLVGLAPASARLRGALVVGAQSGYWGHWPGLGKLKMLGLWYAGIPAFARAFGRLPAWALGGGEDLPRGVALEWARWGRHRDYILSHARATSAPGYDAFRAPLRAYAVTDDSYAPRRAVEALLGFYPNARSELRAVAPRDVGASAIGHFGFFRERFRETLWAEAAGWLEGVGGSP